MITAEAIIKEYNKLTADDDISKFHKTDYIIQLANFPDVLDFYFARLTDSDEYWMVKVEILKILRAWNFRNESEELRISQVLELLLTNADANIRHYAVSAVRWQFAKHGKIEHKIRTIASDLNEDDTVRFAAVKNIRQFGKNKNNLEILKNISLEKNVLAEEALLILNEWD
ncbi:MAG: hypothetical protein HRT89_21800 [Lentisphaeria bacterium]|nr:hypothetical protein [Lentisphaeria bacterium]NQZ70697.1 hypothetical protein [Lentisphaeria bacterium]